MCLVKIVEMTRLSITSPPVCGNTLKSGSSRGIFEIPILQSFYLFFACVREQATTGFSVGAAFFSTKIERNSKSFVFSLSA